MSLDDITTQDLIEELANRCDHLIIAAMFVDTVDPGPENVGDGRVLITYKGNAHTCMGLAMEAAQRVYHIYCETRKPAEL